MTEFLNRIGAARGPGGTTLDDLLTALNNIADKLDTTNSRLYDIFQQTASVNDTLGSPDQCVTSSTVVQLLCRLNNVTEAWPTSEGPASICPGYEAYTHYGPSTLVRSSIGSAQSIYLFNGGEAFWDTAGFTLTNAPWTETAIDASLVPFFTPRIVSPEAGTLNVCVSVNVTGSISSLSLVRLTAGGELAEEQFLANDISDAGRSYTVTLNDSTPYAIQATAPIESSPVVNIWISPEALG